MLRRALGVTPFLLATACAHDVVTPPRAVVGNFGGRGTELIATTDSVRVRFVCSFASFHQPIMPDAEGVFSLSPVLVPTETGPAAISLKGTFSTTRIDFDAVTLSSGGNVRTNHYVVYRDQAGDYSGMGCVANDRQQR